MSFSKFFSGLLCLLFFAQAAAQSYPDMAGFVKLGEQNGHGYYLSNNALTWMNADDFVRLNGGYLVTMNTQEENDFIKNRLGNEMVFIGINDHDQEGQLAWADGEPITLDLHSGNSAVNDFGVMNFWDGHWQLGNKWEQRKFVMEMDNNNPGPSIDSPVQVFIFSGQSNMSGAGITAELNPVLQILPPNVTLRNHFYGVDYADFSNGSFGPELEFIQEIAYAHPTQKYLIIKYAWGGTGLNQWMPGTYHYETLKNKVFQALGSLNQDYELAGFLWMQGETDAFNPYSANSYHQNLSSFINGFRNDLGAPELTVLIGQANPPSSCCVETVQAAQNDFVTEDEHAYLVLTGGIARHWYDPIHYNTAGQIDLGHRFYAAYQAVAPAGLALHCPGNRVENLGEGQDGIPLSWEIADFESACGAEVAVSQISGALSGEEFVAGDYTIAYAAVDSCQNRDTCSFSIQVKEYAPCPTEISGFQRLGELDGHVYFLSENNYTWSDAKTLAAENGGYLTSISTLDENDFLKSGIGNQMVFIGYNDQETEGLGAWANGEHVGYDQSYENGMENDFAVMNFWAGTWQMVNKWVAKPFIMEMDCAISPPDSENSPEPKNGLEISDIYPNPATTTLHFTYSNAYGQEANFQVFDRFGLLYLAEKRILPKGTSIVQLDISDLPKGAYTIKEGKMSASVSFYKF